MCVCIGGRKALTLDVAEQVGANEGEEQHRNGQGTVRQHLPHFGVQKGTEQEREMNQVWDNVIMEEPVTESDWKQNLLWHWPPEPDPTHDPNLALLT